jgi:anaerobic magnesium-protoporphyrin IX monomethyl ester cyclase
MKIILLNPYYSFPEKNYVFHRASIPYNLFYISGFLRKNGIRADVFELGIFNESDRIFLPSGKIRCGISDAEILGILEAEKPDIVGITSMFTIFHEDLVEIIATVKRHNPRVHVVVGGNHASCFPDLMLKSGADQVVVGEGEKAFLSICQGNSDKIIRSAKMVENLDEFPFPQIPYEMFRKYSETSNPFLMRYPAAGIVSSRGCPMDCVYCTVNGVWKRKWRGRSPRDVVEEIEMLVLAYGVREIHFMDDNPSVDRVRWEGILDWLIFKNLNIRWATPMAYWTIDEKLLDKMKRAGCYRLSFGIESGHPETRKFIGKTQPLSRAKEIIQYANKIGLWTITTNIIGFPYETAEQIQATVDFAKECGTDFACFFNLIPHASSRVYPFYLKEKLISPDDDITSIMNEGGCRTVHFTKEQLKDLQKKAYRDFIRHKIFYYLKNPGAIFRKIHSWEDVCYLSRLARLGFSMAIRSISKTVSKTSKDFIYGKRQYV